MVFTSRSQPIHGCPPGAQPSTKITIRRAEAINTVDYLVGCRADPRQVPQRDAVATASTIAEVSVATSAVPVMKGGIV